MTCRNSNAEVISTLGVRLTQETLAGGGISLAGVRIDGILEAVNDKLAEVGSNRSGAIRAL